MAIISPVSSAPDSRHQSGSLLRTLSTSVGSLFRVQDQNEKDSFSVSTAVRLSGEIGAMTRAIGNAREGKSLTEAADEGLDEIDVHLARLEEIAEEAEDTKSSARDRAILQFEFDELLTEIDRIANETEFNGIKVLSSATGSITFKVGTDGSGGDDITLAIQGSAVSDLEPGLASGDVLTATTASQAVTDVATAKSKLADIRSAVDGAAIRFESAVRRLSLDNGTLEQARAGILEPDEAFDLAQAVREQVREATFPFALTRALDAIRGLLLGMSFPDAAVTTFEPSSAQGAPAPAETANADSD